MQTLEATATCPSQQCLPHTRRLALRTSRSRLPSLHSRPKTSARGHQPSSAYRSPSACHSQTSQRCNDTQYTSQGAIHTKLG